ncbi:iron permease FTR1/Fip1/EfeU [Sordaria brevicollis]|uniref:Iron permease FTR1/Fip1/EfeU n=1 Tax=Sordaria brevicollis TaxID=83679 RepID=A0AAE0P367_SORBR|nr:iron permease FTR1/Fip1/EfeU [Sordaria brevicollis]
MQLFSVPIFLLVFRETLETSIIVSVLLVFLKQTLASPLPSSETATNAHPSGHQSISGQPDKIVSHAEISPQNDGALSQSHPKPVDLRLYHALRWQILLGTISGFLLCLVIGGAIIGVFYTLGINKWESSGAELNWEGAFCLLASLIISVVGAALLRVGRMRGRWRIKMVKAMESSKREETKGHGWWPKIKMWMERYVMFVLPFVTVLREGVEAIVFVAGVSFAAPVSSIPIPAVVGVLVGALVGVALYQFGSSTKLQLFLVLSTSLLYLVAAGLFSRAIWAFENQQWANSIGSDAAELGSGPGSYDIDRSVWHVDCCSPNVNGGGGWGIFNAIFGWTNSATYGSVIAYNVYWLVVIFSFFVMRYREVKGRWPMVSRGSEVEDGSKSVTEPLSHHDTGEKASLFDRLSWKKGRS